MHATCIHIHEMCVCILVQCIHHLWGYQYTLALVMHYVCMHTSIYIYIYIYIHTHTQRERERFQFVQCIHIHIHTIFHINTQQCSHIQTHGSRHAQTQHAYTRCTEALHVNPHKHRMTGTRIPMKRRTVAMMMMMMMMMSLRRRRMMQERKKKRSVNTGKPWYHSFTYELVVKF